MTDYPEHEKLRKVSEISNEIGRFLDFGLPRMGLELYESRECDCECRGCARDYALDESSPAWGMHTKEECDQAKAERRPVQLTVTVPTIRTAQSILAEYFGIDQKKLYEEKDQMLAALREEIS